MHRTRLNRFRCCLAWLMQTQLTMRRHEEVMNAITQYLGLGIFGCTFGSFVNKTGRETEFSNTSGSDRLHKFRFV